MRRRILALGAVLACLVAGCSSSHRAAATTTTSTVPGPNPDVVPAVITPAYVNAVLADLNHVYGNATRALVATKAVTPAVREDLRAIFNDPLFAQQLSEATQSLSGPIQNVRSDPGDGTITVRRLIRSSGTCIFVETETNLSTVLVRPSPSPVAEYYELDLKQKGIDPNHLNPTPWAFGYNVDFFTNAPAPQRCVGS